MCLKFCILLEVKWIARDLNARADAISKLIDHDEYAINDATFKRIDHFWGPILLTDLLVPIMLKYQDLPRNFFRMAMKQLMHSPKIGGTIIIGFVLQCVC